MAVAGGLRLGVPIAIGVPASTLEGDGRRREDAFEQAAAVGAEGNLGVGKLLNLFSVLVAGGAFVLIKRHDCLL